MRDIEKIYLEVGKMEIKKKSPNPFYLAGDERTVLLLHGFTGSPSELRPLGEFLSKTGRTVYAPLLPGHGKSPEDLAQTTWQDWWRGVVDSYQKLMVEGAKTLVVIGLSMGGVLALRLAMHFPLQGVVTMAAPTHVRDKRIRYAKLISYFYPYQPRKEKKAPYIENELVPLEKTPVKAAYELYKLINEVRRRLDEVMVPTLILQGKMDETIFPESAQYIYNHLDTEDKKLIWYPKAGHILPLEQEREKIFQDSLEFIEQVEKRFLE